MEKILITGATGPLGKAVTERLIALQGPAALSVLARDPAKAADLQAKGVTVLQADYNDYNSLLQAFTGISKLYFVSGNDIAHRIPQHENVVKAATEAGVGHIHYTSFQRRTEDGSSPIAFLAAAHLHTEQLIRASGITYTILKHSLYADFLPMFLGNQVITTGQLFFPAGEGKGAFAVRQDMAEAGAAVLASSGHENKAYEICGSHAYSFAEVAEILSELAGKKIVYTAAEPAAYAELLTKAGAPEMAIQAGVGFGQAIAQGEFDFPDDTMERLLGRPAFSLREILKNAYIR
ncbi:MAG: SDR family oxidoreductase [Candidatus Pseudobacter hemicellulosilyticus]|uniref:SDR family oxidoreductase n=1 Tax=Candidatus Pseudobacter hemicellulosilyticus TaxID=3121375 RepID=A0AAJ5WRA2_9BACT|nr:MAG: SDR family oxidoreductase [Pseudobacter sp.]